MDTVEVEAKVKKPRAVKPKVERTPEKIQADKEKMAKIRAMRKPKA